MDTLTFTFGILAAITVDRAVPDEVMAKLRGIGGIVNLEMV